MSNANSISDLERAEHLNYADGKGVKRVSIFNNGVQANAATEETLQLIVDPLAKYKSAGMDIASNPMYFGYLDKDGNWYIKKLDTTSGTTYVKGTSDYETAWTGRESLEYGLYNTIF